MLHFPFVNVPDYFSRLLKMNVNRDVAFDALIQEFRTNQALKSLVEGIIREKQTRGNAEKVLRTQGWTNLREKLASIYISKARSGKWPHKVELSAAANVFDFEERLKDHTVEGIYRGFLLGLYFELGKVQYESGERVMREGEYFQIPAGVFDILKTFKVKVVHIDWLILWLSYFHEFLGKDVLLKKIRENTPFETIVKELSTEQREHILQNMLSYGASVNDESFFLEDEV